jgi:hypothetical protein
MSTRIEERSASCQQTLIFIYCLRLPPMAEYEYEKEGIDSIEIHSIRGVQREVRPDLPKTRKPSRCISTAFVMARLCEKFAASARRLWALLLRCL